MRPATVPGDRLQMLMHGDLAWCLLQTLIRAFKAWARHWILRGLTEIFLLLWTNPIWSSVQTKPNILNVSSISVSVRQIKPGQNRKVWAPWSTMAWRTGRAVCVAWWEVSVLHQGRKWNGLCYLLGAVWPAIKKVKANQPKALNQDWYQIKKALYFRIELLYHRWDSIRTHRCLF